MHTPSRYTDKNSKNCFFHEEGFGLFQAEHYGYSFHYSRPPSYELEADGGSGINLIDSCLFNLLSFRRLYKIKSKPF